MKVKNYYWPAPLVAVAFFLTTRRNLIELALYAVLSLGGLPLGGPR